MSSKVYALAQLRVHDRSRYDAYARQFLAALSRFEARLLVAEEQPELLEGAWPHEKVVLVEFPSEAALRAWASSDAYQRLAEQRRAASEATLLRLNGFDAGVGLDAARARYDRIGVSYATTRKEDPALRAAIHAALGDACSVLNVGAGAGSYEPTDRQVIAVEPSDVMAAQRPPTAAPALRASAEDLPLRDRSLDAAMAILTLHHWDAGRERGVRELRRVARGPVVIVTIDPRVSASMWLLKDYLVEVAELDHQIFPHPEQIAGWLGGDVRIEALPVAHDTPDWMLLSYWAHPERVLDARARAGTSGFARMPASVVDRVVADVARDLADGTWDQRYGELRSLDACDVGLRLICAR
jgi:uncharacterized protein (DUF1330 family)/ubiquinone/menaquinone biosynthesis C-methylase UbiE